jgi:hypothetical protein
MSTGRRAANELHGGVQWKPNKWERRDCESPAPWHQGG